MSDYEKTDLNKVKRLPKRGHYDQETLYQILDEGFMCHIGFLVEGRPVVIPTAFVRDGNSLLIHGSSKSRMIQTLAAGSPCCVTITHLDALVPARSVFNHSMNYRSAVVFGKGTLIEEPDEKMEGLRLITENILPGRWEEARSPNEKEMKATSVVRIHIETASSKIRTGPPGDDAPDYELPKWAGLLPLHTAYAAPIPDPVLSPGIPVPDSVNRAGTL